MEFDHGDQEEHRLQEAEFDPPPARGAGTKQAERREAQGVRTEADGNVLERGDIFFFYRPDVEQDSPNRLLDAPVSRRPPPGGTRRAATDHDRPQDLAEQGRRRP